MFACCCSSTHGGCGWEQHPLPAATSHTEPSQPAGGCAGAATLPTACRALQLHFFLLVLLLTTASLSPHSFLLASLLPPCPPPHSFLLVPLLPLCPPPSSLPLCSGASLWVRGISSSVSRQLQRGCLASSHLPGAPRLGSCLALTFLRLEMPSSRLSQGCSSPRGCPTDAWSQMA